MDEDTKALYKRLYNFTLGEGLDAFDLVLSTDKLTRKEVFEKTLKALKGK